MMVGVHPVKPPLSAEPPWEELERVFPGRVSRRVAMSGLTTFRVGGVADALLTPASPGEVSDALIWAHEREVPTMVLGAGSNLLVRDGGIRGLVLRIAPPLDRWDAHEGEDSFLVRAQAGLPLRRLLREAVRRGWEGIPFLVGIPGSLGGSVAMNAGARDGALEQVVAEVAWVQPHGKTVWRHRSDLAFSYRRLDLPMGAVIVEVRLRLPKGDAREVREAFRARMLQRRRTQPLGLPCAGSVFRNPPGEFAGGIIERLGLKGLSRGGAQISSRHANFIVNAGGASATDVLALIREVRRRVVEATGIHLDLEIRVVGEDR
jgi:UDP-N-acetylmuramate dehydrogenase